MVLLGGYWEAGVMFRRICNFCCHVESRFGKQGSHGHGCICQFKGHLGTLKENVFSEMREKYVVRFY